MLSYKEPISEAGTVEIGYGVASSREGRGIATQAVAALVAIASGHGVRTLLAETARDNIASQRVLERNGFIRTGKRVDGEDGPLILWSRNIA